MTDEPGCLLDTMMPQFDVSERHEIVLPVRLSRAYAAIHTTDFAASRTVGLLLALRAMPARLLGRGGGARTGVRQPMTLATIESRGFVKLAEQVDREIVFGLEGQFWRLNGGVCTPRATAFATTAPRPGTARAVWNFACAPVNASTTRVSTETRVLCADATTRRHFRLYWTVIRPGSAIIRRMMLRQLKREAMRASGA